MGPGDLTDAIECALTAIEPIPPGFLFPFAVIAIVEPYAVYLALEGYLKCKACGLAEEVDWGAPDGETEYD